MVYITSEASQTGESVVHGPSVECSAGLTGVAALEVADSGVLLLPCLATRSIRSILITGKAMSTDWYTLTSQVPFCRARCLQLPHMGYKQKRETRIMPTNA